MFPHRDHSWFKALLCLCAALVLSACATTAERDPQPIKSPGDDYTYRLLTLDNGLEVLLISNPDTPKAAAALDINVGSGDNPPGRGGLAHFLEHMLFLGTDKYPDAAEYERFITEHGGSRNAYTSFENTNYFFDVNPEFLPEALDRFAQFFIAPRFDAQYVDREKNAVQAEYQMGLKSDPRRGLDVMQEVMNPDHPFSQFSVGSLETLEDRPGSSIRDELIAFYDTRYSANIMRLAVLGAEPLDELEALVAPMFSAVPNRGFEHDVISAPLFVEDSLPMYVQVQPLATLRQLDVSFPVPDYRAEYRTKPVSYLGNLVGHEGEGSLLSRLKKEGLAESLFAGSGLSWRGGALFSVGISLTARGAEQPDRVLQLLFAHVEMLRSQGPQEWLYEEQSRVAELGFRFREHGSPMGYVSALASGMQHFDAEDILRGPYTMDSYDADVLAELLDYIRPNNALVTLSNADVEVDRVSRYYEVDYSRKPLALSQLAIERDDAALAELRLPPPNEFIAEDIALVGLPADAPDAPQVTLDTDRQKIWFKTDDEFRRPKGATYINFRSPQVNQSPEQSARAALYASLAMDKVNEFAYPAQIAGLSFEFYKHAQGLSLRVRGYNDKQALLLQKLLVELVEPDFDPARFENIRSDMIRGLENTVAKRPSSQSLDDLREALLPGTWGEQALIDALRATELDDIQEYVPDFWRGASAEALVYGNYEQETVQQLNKMLAVVLPAGPGPALPAVEVVRLAPGEAIQYAVDIEHDDAVLAWYLQGEGDSWRDKAATALTAQVMKSGFFQELRTEQQLGYIVAAFNWTQLEVPGLVMLIQSPVADADALATAMLTFLDGVQPDLDAEQFARHKAALVSDILRPDENLGERAEFYWQSIARKQYDFEGRRTLADAVEALTLEDWQAYFERVFLKRQHSLQVVSPGRWNKLPTDGGRLYDDAGAIKATHETYRLE